MMKKRLIGLTEQEQRVVKYMMENGGITSYEAFKYCNATRLSAVIFNLKEKGWNINKVFEKNKKTKTNYARYYLVNTNGR